MKILNKVLQSPNEGTEMIKNNISKLKKYALEKGYNVDEEATEEHLRRLTLSNEKSVSIRLPIDVIEEYKKKAGKNGKYQALMREILIDSLKTGS